MRSILVLNGPNLNLLGTRQPEIYGSTTLSDVEDMCHAHATARGARVVCAQNNYEGGLVEQIHAARGVHDGMVLNAGAYTHTSIAIMDAIKGTDLPTIELHVSNVHARESFRHHSYISAVAVGVIAGLGIQGYTLAIDGILGHLERLT